MKVKRIADYTSLERLVIKEMWVKIKETPKDGKVRTFRGGMKHNNIRYNITCDFLLRGEYLTIEKLEVHQEEKLILTTEDIKVGAPIYKEIYIPENFH